MDRSNCSLLRHGLLSRRAVVVLRPFQACYIRGGLSFYDHSETSERSRVSDGGRGQKGAGNYLTVYLLLRVSVPARRYIPNMKGCIALEGRNIYYQSEHLALT